jgi:hypothetical protein
MSARASWPPAAPTTSRTCLSQGDPDQITTNLVPEPTMGLLLASGLIGLGLIRPRLIGRNR